MLRLKAAIASIDQLVSLSLFAIGGTNPDCSIRFHTENDQRLFNVLLVDLLNPMDHDLVGVDQSVLAGLSSTCARPNFDLEGTVGAMSAPVATIENWLNTEMTVSLDLASIRKSVDLRIKRHEFIEACGNISKHNFTRLTRTGTKIRKIFVRNNIGLAEWEDLLILDDFYERFHTDILNYHASALVEMLNDVRWGLHRYLTPEYRRSVTRKGGEPPRISYKYPPSVTNPAARVWYRDLMSDIGTDPPIQPFVCTKYLKMRY